MCPICGDKVAARERVYPFMNMKANIKYHTGLGKQVVRIKLQNV